MTRYVLGRLGSGLVTLFLFVTLLFFLVNIVVPGDFVTSFGPMSAEAGQAARESLGLDRPLPLQYLDWLTALATLDLGISFNGPPVWETIRETMPVTLLVLVVGLGTAFVLGGWLGRIAGHRGNSLLSGSLVFVAIALLTAFPPTLAIALEQGATELLGFRRAGEFGSLEYGDLWLFSGVDPGRFLSPPDVIWRMLIVFAVTAAVLWIAELAVSRALRRRLPVWLFLIAMIAIPLLSWAQMGLSRYAFDILAASALLILGILVLTFGDVLLITRAAMDDVMLEDYVMVARAKGLPERRVRDRHAARVALLPVLSRFTVSVPYFLTGLVILEAVFAGAGIAGTVPFLQRFEGPRGLGAVLFDAVRLQDTPMIVGGLLVVGVLTLLLRTALDVAHAALDPRIGFNETVHHD